VGYPVKSLTDSLGSRDCQDLSGGGGKHVGLKNRLGTIQEGFLFTNSTGKKETSNFAVLFLYRGKTFNASFWTGEKESGVGETVKGIEGNRAGARGEGGL